MIDGRAAGRGGCATRHAESSTIGLGFTFVCAIRNVLSSRSWPGRALRSYRGHSESRGAMGRVVTGRGRPGGDGNRLRGSFLWAGVNGWLALVLLVAMIIAAVVIFLPSAEPFERILRLVEAVVGTVR